MTVVSANGCRVCVCERMMLARIGKKKTLERVKKKMENKKKFPKKNVVLMAKIEKVFFFFAIFGVLSKRKGCDLKLCCRKCL